MDGGQPLPRLWLMTDERMGDDLMRALARLPAGGGIVFRHYSLAPAERRSLFEAVKATAHKRGQMLLLAGPDDEARAWGADGSHGRGPGTGFRSAPVHDLAEIEAARRDRADLLFLSPVFPTRSHPDAPALGPEQFSRLARTAHAKVIALGGMTAERFVALDGAWGWAGIDAWLPDRPGARGT